MKHQQTKITRLSPALAAAVEAHQAFGPPAGPEGTQPWGRWIAGVRHQTGVSQARFAAYLAPGLSVRTLHGWESGRNVPPVWVRWLIAARVGQEPVPGD